MRINQYLAQATGMSRRAADTAVSSGRVQINGELIELGASVAESDTVTLDGQIVTAPDTYTYVVFNKPIGYVTSRAQQGNAPTIYDVLPTEYHELKPVGRLDKDSSGLLLLTNDGELANQLTHPSHQKEKVYHVELDRPLTGTDQQKIEQGVDLEDGKSALRLEGGGKSWIVRMSEGRNRQIRRTFDALGYTVTRLHRTAFGNLELGPLSSGETRPVEREEII